MCLSAMVNTSTTYGNLSSVTVSKGQKLKAGQTIGKAGTKRRRKRGSRIPASAGSKKPGSRLVDPEKIKESLTLR